MLKLYLKGCGDLPRLRKAKTGNEPLPANQQKGEKKCNFCHETKKVTSFYISKNPIHSADERVPICKDCVMKASLNEDGTINDLEFNKILKVIDRPYYKDLIESSVQSFVKEHSYIDADKVKFYGKEILSIYFRCIAMRQDREKSYQDSEKDGFIHQNNNKPKSAKERIAKKYADINENPYTEEAEAKVRWSKVDKQNRDYVIETIGYDPFQDYPEEDRRFLFNQMLPYLEDEDNIEDAYKLSQILQIVNNNKQIYVYDKKIANLDPLADANDIKTLNAIKKDLVTSNDKIAKENEISVKNRSNKDVGKSTLTYLMRDLRERNFDRAEADYYDQLRGEGTQWAISVSQKAILDHCLFDENDKKEIYETQLNLINDLYKELDDKKEQVRQLSITIDELKRELESVRVGSE